MLTILNFDDAVVDYFSSFFDYVVWGAPNVAFKNAAMKWDDKVPLPLISIYRSELALASLRNFPLFKKGNMTGLSEKNVNRERVLPMMMSYQADIWGSDLEQATQLFCEVLFRTLDKPMIPVHLEGKEEPVMKELRLLDIVDNNDATQISSRGRLNRYSILYQVDGYIAKLVENDRIFIVPKFYSYDGKELK